MSEYQKMQESQSITALVSEGVTPSVLPQTRTIFYFLLAFVVIFWTLVPILGHHTPPLDVIEMTTWAQVPQLGYYKHPPLPAWGIYLSELIFGRNSFALFIPSALSIGIAILAVWPLALRFFGAKRGVIALFLQSTLIYYNMYAPDYNHNVAQIPFWALTVSAFYFAVSDGRARYWIFFGAALGVTTLSKYSAAFLPLACVVLLMWEKEARRYLSVTNISLAAIAFFAVLGPHLFWLVKHDFAPIHYMNDRLGDLSLNASWSERFISYVGMQVLVHLVLICVGVWCARGKHVQPDVNLNAPMASKVGRLNQRFLWAMGLGPFAITVVLGLSGSYLHPMWATAMFPLSGLIFVQLLSARIDVLWSPRWLIAWILLMSFFGAIYAAKNTAGWHQLTNKYARASYPGPELARELDQKWRLAFPGKPLRFIVGTPWEAGVASFESSFDTRVLIEGDLTISPWISKNKLSNCGALVVWDPNVDMLTPLKRDWPQIREQEQLSIIPDRANTFAALRLSWAIIPPQGNCN
ncbi:glycosyltransferase family 39 protein [Undibacterium sp. Ren11W]|uniref:glycosyltransferase family 39 protein n=1 Tax=Undibacterium sp. Ren11W TaxID=3413045 RepID=UPI003BF34907